MARNVGSGLCSDRSSHVASTRELRADRGCVEIQHLKKVVASLQLREQSSSPTVVATLHGARVRCKVEFGMVDDDSDTVLSSESSDASEPETSGGDTILAAAPPPPTSTLSPALKLTDFVPILRPELDIEPQENGAVLLIDTETDRNVRMSAFEIRIGRLLDGKRRASKLVETVAAFDIPFTLESLQTLITKFEELDLLVGRRRKRLPIGSPKHGEQFDQTVRQPVPAEQSVTRSAALHDIGTRPTEPVDVIAEEAPSEPAPVEPPKPPVRASRLRPVLTGIALAAVVLAILYVTFARR
jgi:hypothetical protein